MKENVKDRLNLGEIKLRDILKEVGKQAAAAVCGFILSRGLVFGELLPFGLAYAAAVPAEYLALSAFGSFVGYFIPASSAGAFRYLAALFAIVAIKALLASMTKYASRPIIAAVTAGIVACATGVVTTVGNPKATLFAVCEAALAFAGGYFISKTFKTRRLRAGLSAEELSCLLISSSLVIIGSASITVGDISLGRILSVIFILLVSRFGHTSAGAICGIVSGFASAMAGGGLSVAVALSLAGLMSGIFATWGKYAQVGVFLLSSLVGSAVGNDIILTVKFIIETTFGCAVFLCIPKSAAMKVGKIFSPPSKTLSESGMKKTVTMRLNYAASALSDVSETVDSVAKELSRINSPDFDTVLSGVENDACSGCSLCVHCWEAKKSDTISAVLDMIKAVKEGGESPEKGADEEFRGRCLRPARMGDAVRKHYSDYASAMAAESRIADVRNVVADQFDGISNMLYDMAEELDRDEAFDDRTAAKIAEAFKNMDIHVIESGCRIDKYGRMTVEVIARAVAGTRYNRMKLLRQVEVCCDRDFEPPTVTETKGKVFITLTERAAIMVDTGICQFACSPSGISGDAYSSFSDGKGRAFMIISDGMGSGGRAAVDGAMASGLMTRLLKAGFGYDCSLRIVNSAMLFKSTDESLATVDIACIDLFSGRTDMLKAGAAPSIVRRSGKCGVAQSTSLPAGILREVGFDKATIKLRAGDIIVMMSDGATSEGTDWICAEIEGWKDKNAQQLAEHLAACAKRRRSDNHEDDITVMTAIIEKTA